MEDTKQAPANASAPQAAGGKARMQALSPEEKHAIASKAARARWKKSKAAKKATRSANRRWAQLDSLSAMPAIFSETLETAEARYTEAMQLRTLYAGKIALLDAQIPSLIQTITALKNSLNPVSPAASVYPPPPVYPVSGAGTRSLSPAHAPEIARNLDRVHGGATGENLAEESEDDQFLKDSPVAAGNWH